MTQTHMKREIAEIPQVVERLLGEGRGAIVEAAKALRAADPDVMITIARGSSDHAATYFKYACELTTGVPVASVGPSIASIYGVDLKLGRAGAIGISQSGKSPDIVAMLESARRSGATTIAITNTATSPLAEAADHVVDICAGTEQSVAATKTFVTSAVAELALLAEWSGDERLGRVLDGLPEALANALDCDWSALVEATAGVNSLYVLGRGPGAAIASEAALKFKETSGLHAEAYSTAEVLHGPAAIVQHGFPVLALCVADKARESILETCSRLAGQGGQVFVTDPQPGAGTPLPVARTGHPLTDPIALVVSFYGFIEALSRRRGFNPDEPPHLRKVTSTL
ncbi:SIS domain-containing protein [Pelagibacterium luteolum]|uniref:Glucosamine--fructose-6-phosphate aminotransferase (Isomerizing) n=1 Tax=Pelagibacterium luteolum TaxID=440168 RepID=A0A1G7VJ87_9HYPH|nr:SIS domain-containing protein [Pelagibacterium luteolum]SDG59469.1 glucosamine--fructose-6-phosphate aminotransferase (isomerizing) [Pelagibacterium luteolum]